MKMNEVTPANTISPKHRKLNSEAMRECLKVIPRGKIKRVVDIRYGLGGWASVLRQKFPSSFLLGYEQDVDTYSESLKPDNSSIHNSLYRAGSNSESWDLLLADFNNLTTLKKNSLLEALEDFKPKWVIFTDVSCSKLHLNYKSYGLGQPSLDDYWDSFVLPDYQFVSYSRSHYHASTSVWKRKKPRKKRG